MTSYIVKFRLLKDGRESLWCSRPFEWRSVAEVHCNVESYRLTNRGYEVLSIEVIVVTTGVCEVEAASVDRILTACERMEAL